DSDRLACASRFAPGDARDDRRARSPGDGVSLRAPPSVSLARVRGLASHLWTKAPEPRAKRQSRPVHWPDTERSPHARARAQSSLHRVGERGAGSGERGARSETAEIRLTALAL